MFNIEFEHETGGKRDFVYQNSWGITTRTIGVMIMVHGDNRGLVLPPRIAPIQVVIIPIFFKNKSTDDVCKVANVIEKNLKLLGVRTHVDSRDYKTPGWKYNYWELKGVPLRIEIGPRDLDKECVTIARRDIGEKESVSIYGAHKHIFSKLEDIQNTMFNRAVVTRNNMIATITGWHEFVQQLNTKRQVLAPFCEGENCEEEIKKKSSEESKNLDSESGLTGGAKSLCIPFDQTISNMPLPDKCFNCGNIAKSWTLFGRSY